MFYDIIVSRPGQSPGPGPGFTSTMGGSIAWRARAYLPYLCYGPGQPFHQLPTIRLDSNDSALTGLAAIRRNGPHRHLIQVITGHICQTQVT